MIARVILAYLLALPVFVVVAARETEGSRNFTVVVRMATGVSGLLQLYADTGRGFSERESYVYPLFPDGQPHDYRFPIPPGRYRAFRIDPGMLPGRSTIFGVEIADADGATMVRAPLIGVQPVTQVPTIARDDEKVTFETRPGDFDPQLGWTPPAPLRLYRTVSPSKPVGALLMAWGAAAAVVLLGAASIGGFARRLDAWAARFGAAFARWPRATMVAAATAGALVSSYPVLFAGRSLFSPHNGGNRMLYQHLPFTPGTQDQQIEDGRGSDIATGTWMFLPFTRIQREALRQGEFPLWNRYNAGGRPLWGQGYGFMLDPLHWIALAVPDLSWALDLKYVAHRLVFAIGIGLLGLAITGEWLPAAIVAASAPFVGIYNFRFNHPQPFALTYIPWVLLAWLAIASGGKAARRGAWLLAAAVTLVLFASLPKEAVVSLLAACAMGTAVLLLSARRWRERLAGLVWAAVAGFAALLATAPHWLNFLDTLRQSETAYDRPYAMFGSLDGALALFLGPLTPAEVLPGLHAVALVGLIAAITAPNLWRSNRPALIAALASLGLLAMAFGAPPARAILRVPLLANIGHVHDVFVLAAAPIALMASAAGLKVLLHADRRRTVVVTAAAAAAAGALFAIAVYVSPPGVVEPYVAFAALSAAVVLPLLLGGAAREPVSTARMAAACAALVVLLLPGGLHLDTKLPTLDQLLFQPRFRVDYGAPAPVLDAIVPGGGEPARASGIEWVLFPGSQGVYGVEGLSGGGDALQLPLYERLADAAGLSRGWFYFLTLQPDSLPRAAGFLDLMNVRHLLMDPWVKVADGDPAVVPAGDRLAVSRRSGAWPRAFFVDGVSTYNTLDEFVRLLGPRTGPLAAVQAGDARAVSAVAPLERRSAVAVPADRYRLTTNSTAFHLRTPAAGAAVLTETYLENDFVVTLNGSRVPYFRVNHAFKGIAIPSAGDWDVRVEYRPAYWRLSLMAGAAGAVIIAALGVRAVRGPAPA